MNEYYSICFHATRCNNRNSPQNIPVYPARRGIPKEIDIFETESLGLKLTRNLVLHQLKGQLQITRNNGTEALIEFPVLEEDG
jgi:hypothetical protein